MAPPQARRSRGWPAHNTFSGPFPRAAASGACGSDWHVLFSARDEDALAKAAARALAIGHTSGADGLAGFLAVRTAALQMDKRTGVDG